MVMTTDSRQCIKLRHSKRPAIQEKANRRSRLCHSNSSLMNRNRPAGSWIRDQLVDFTSDRPEEYEWDGIEQYGEDSRDREEIFMYIDAQWQEIYDALDLNNADLLDSLIPPINLFNGKTKYWQNQSDQRCYQGGDNILTQAILLEHTNCIRVLLDKLYCGDLDPAVVDSHLSYSETPLLCACEKGDLNLVQELIECAHANIHQDQILLVAIEQNHKILVEYLLSQGCDPRHRFNHGALHAASRRGHLEIVQSLLKYDTDPNEQDCHGRTPFDYAMDGEHIDIAKVLLIHTGGYITANEDNFTPMMTAAHYDRKPIVDLLFQLLPIDRAVDDLLRLACRYTIESPMQNRERALYFFAQGLRSDQTSNHLSLPEVYELQYECRTFEQLESIQDDDHALLMHALIVNERLFLQHGDLNFYIDFLEAQCENYLHHQLFNQSLHLRIHAYQAMLRVLNDTEDSPGLKHYQCSSLMQNLESILRQSGIVPIDSLVIIGNWMLNQTTRVYHSTQCQLLIMIICMFQSKQTTREEQNVLYRLIQRFAQQQTKQRTFLTFFIQAIRRKILVHQCGPYSLSTLSIICLLIQCGSDVNQICDSERNRPLHLIARCSDIIIAKPIIELLLSAGAHPDTIDDEGRSPKDVTEARDVKQFLIKHRQLSLKCRCAQMIVSREINYQNYLSSNLVAFVQLHSNSEPNPLSHVIFQSAYHW